MFSSRNFNTNHVVHGHVIFVEQLKTKTQFCKIKWAVNCDRKIPGTLWEISEAVPKQISMRKMTKIITQSHGNETNKDKTNIIYFDPHKL